MAPTARILDQTERGKAFSLDLVCACVMGFAFSANYINHAPLVPALTQAFSFSLAMAGFLTTGVFLTHAGMQVPGGHLADLLGARQVVTIALAVVCLGNFAIAFATAYWQLLLWKMFVGLGTGTCFVAGARYVSAAQSGRRSHLAQGYYGGSIMLGSGFVILAVPRFADAFGWRGGFLITATLAAAAWVLWVAAAPTSSGSSRPQGSFGGMIANPQLWLLGLAQMASFGLVIVISAWITTFLRRGLHIDPVTAGLIGSIALMLGIVMRPLGGVLVGVIGVRPLIRLSLVLSAAGCFLLASAGNSVAWVTVAILLIGVGCGCPYAALFTSAAALYPERAGAAMGLVNMLGIIMILAAPPLIGRFVDWSGSFQSSFMALGFFSLVALMGTLGIDES
ncbi:MAG TPA: MFS transporter [Acidobacteriota bacterium]|nr:MFS transporter [Acidobacteriota bacterium]